ncbi:MAG TPA: helix-turn-helix transcriptional regulator [Anaerolineales bacterium]|jgi:putative transcriptional regulator|nr:helix-turn-helix transcriptional regulator [Anaerolineales bacterium]
MTNNLAHLVLYQLHGRSIKQFAKEAGISQSYLSEILSGKKNPSPAVVQKLSQALNTSAIQLYFMLGWLKEPNNEDAVIMDTIAGDSNLHQLVTLYLDLSVRDRKVMTHIAKTLKELDIQ